MRGVKWFREIMGGIRKVLCHPRILALCRRETSTAEYLRLIFPRADQERLFQEIWGKRIATAALLLAAVLAAALYGFLKAPGFTPESGECGLMDGKFLVRGAEEEETALTVAGAAEGNSWEKTMSFNVKERQFSDEEKQELAEKTGRYVRQTLPGENKSLQEIRSPLCLVSSVPETGIALEWTVDDTWFRESGEVKTKAVPEEGAETELMVRAQWKNWKETFYFPVRLLPEKLTGAQAAVREARQAVKEVMREQADQAVVELPARAGEFALEYRMPEGERDFSLLFISLLAAVLVPLMWFRRQKKQLADRENSLLLDHPAFINRIMLLLGAGLTVRGSIERLADEYGENRKKGGGKSYLYEEICVMAQEMRDGVSESRAVERFGRRCGLLPYLRFSSVITQNLKKGAEGILDILEKESLEALEKRKERVLQLGEMAGTKLLFPMVLMLGLVMAILMVPAFMVM